MLVTWSYCCKDLSLFVRCCHESDPLTCKNSVNFKIYPTKHIEHWRRGGWHSYVTLGIGLMRLFNKQESFSKLLYFQFDKSLNFTFKKKKNFFLLFHGLQAY